MRVRHAVLGISIAAACRSGRTDESATLEVRSGSAVIERIPVETTDLWQWCDEGVTAVVARADNGFVVGACAQRDGQTFQLSRTSDGKALATLSRSDDKTTLSHAQPVSWIDLRVTGTAKPASLSIAIAGRPPLTLDAAALDALTPRHHRREGVPLTAILDNVGVSTARTITIRGATTYQVDPAWLANRTLTVRRNHRGELKFNDEASGTRISQLTTIEIEPEPR